jgi:hypothetical protein
MGAYCAYQVAVGEWGQLVQNAPVGVKGRIVLYSLPVVLPLCGIALIIYGFKKLVEKPGAWGEK